MRVLWNPRLTDRSPSYPPSPAEPCGGGSAGGGSVGGGSLGGSPPGGSSSGGGTSSISAGISGSGVRSTVRTGATRLIGFELTSTSGP
ncbi:MAG: hypothetical protein DCC46_05435 [Armatimonadetes bacterium]|nr:MAG: hypothetical protein DCC46_05435 [Armatimonadota bacterium]